VDGRLLPQIPFHVCCSAGWFLGKFPVLLYDQVRSKLVLNVGCGEGEGASGLRANQYCMKLEHGIEHIAIYFDRILESHWFVWATQISHLPMPVDLEKKKDWVSMQVL